MVVEIFSGVGNIAKVFRGKLTQLLLCRCPDTTTHKFQKNSSAA